MQNANSVAVLLSMIDASGRVQPADYAKIRDHMERAFDAFISNNPAFKLHLGLARRAYRKAVAA